jgi:hypothetical protein
MKLKYWWPEITFLIVVLSSSVCMVVTRPPGAAWTLEGGHCYRHYDQSWLRAAYNEEVPCP